MRRRCVDRKGLIPSSDLPQRRRNPLILGFRHAQLAPHRRQVLVHRRHDQLGPRRRPTQRSGLSPYRASLITNRPRGHAALLADHTTVRNGLRQLLIQAPSSGSGLLIHTSHPGHTTAQPAHTLRRCRHRPAITRSGQLAAPTFSRIQVMRTGQQPVHTSHKRRNTHPLKLSGALSAMPRPNPTKRRASSTQIRCIKTASCSAAC